MESVFTFADNSIDVVGAFFFASAIFWSLHYIWENHLTTSGRVIYLFIVAISSLHIFQVIYQVSTGGFAIFRVWDIINYLTAILFLMMAHRLYKRESTNICNLE
jgi:hypothetical protein